VYGRTPHRIGQQQVWFSLFQTVSWMGEVDGRRRGRGRGHAWGKGPWTVDRHDPFT